MSQTLKIWELAKHIRGTPQVQMQRMNEVIRPFALPQTKISVITLVVLALAAVACGSAPTVTPFSQATAAPASLGQELFVSKGCAACHGQNAEGSAIAPALPGHSKQMVKRQVRTPRFQMPPMEIRLHLPLDGKV